jgi:MFS family permease
MNLASSGKPSRLAGLTAFFINGALLATWVSRIPATQSKLGLSESELGLTLLGMSAGLLTALSLAGGLITRFGSPRVILTGTIVASLTLPLLTLAPNPVLLWLLLFLFGGALSGMDVAMNEQAVLVERLTKRPLMSSFHAAWSVGGLAGALLGAAMASTPTLTPFLHFVIAAAIFGGGIFFSFPRLLPVKREIPEDKAVFRLPERALWTLGAVAFCAVIAEGAMADWSAVYLTRILNIGPGFAALGFAAFSLTMTVGRLIGDALTAAWGPLIMVRAGSFISVLGFLTALLTSEPIVALAGFAAIGLGVSNIVPLAFSAAGNYPELPTGASIASVATVGYAGFLVGPPLIGFVAEETSLPIALSLIALLVGTLMFTAKAISSPKRVGEDGMRSS